MLKSLIFKSTQTLSLTWLDNNKTSKDIKNDGNTIRSDFLVAKSFVQTRSGTLPSF